ncbi:uncharacterized protein LOC127727198 [Mytilus californianus]|uniref:uncharacterized protein LOC127727198 n=1 Tax=Mytilus californianus TaxID=6549 RepID=UPI0022480A90|nr:uncharacterized protein LOC127727198 [Mytilus californianus]
MIFWKNYKVGVLSALCVLCFWITVHLHNVWFDIVDKSTTAVPTAKMSITQLKNKDDYLEEMDILNKQKVDMDDPRLINLIRNYWIENPSDKPYNLNKPHVIDPSIGQAAFVDNRLNFKIGGFFVECGALDGETRSNTLIFERTRSWNGLLIEADPSNYKLLRNKNRKAFTINACLSVYSYPVKMQFKKNFSVGKILQNQNSTGKDIVDVQCFPFYSIMKALNVTHVDFFSLDVEGAELQVLQTIPFGKLDIDMMTVEFIHVPAGEAQLKKFVEKHGYSSLMKMSHYNGLANDIIFRKNV